MPRECTTDRLFLQVRKQPDMIPLQPARSHPPKRWPQGRAAHGETSSRRNATIGVAAARGEVPRPDHHRAARRRSPVAGHGLHGRQLHRNHRHPLRHPAGHLRGISLRVGRHAAVPPTQPCKRRAARQGTPRRRDARDSAPRSRRRRPRKPRKRARRCRPTANWSKRYRCKWTSRRSRANPKRRSTSTRSSSTPEATQPAQRHVRAARPHGQRLSATPPKRAASPNRRPSRAANRRRSTAS